MKLKTYLAGLGLLALIASSCKTENKARNEMYERQIKIYEDSIATLNQRITEFENEFPDQALQLRFKNLSEEYDSMIEKYGDSKSDSKPSALEELRDLTKEIQEALKEPPKKTK